MHSSIHTTATRRLAAFFLTALLALGALALPGCAGTSDEDVIRDGVTQMLDAIKNPTKENLSAYIGELDNEQTQALEAYGLDIYEFFSHAFRNFDYTINDITVDGDKATVELEVTNIDVAKVASTVVEKAQTDEAIAGEVQKIAEKGNQSEVMKYVFALIYEELDATNETVTNKASLKLVKTDNEWSFDETSFQALVNSMYGGLTN